MFQEIVGEIVRKVLNDKILLGLLIVCLLGVFVGGISFNHNQQRTNEDGTTTAPSASSNDAPVDNYSRGGQLTPALAVQFVKWWVRSAMDYAPASAAQSHQAAGNWMTAGAAKCFDEAFWTPQLAQQVISGAAAGVFQPIAVVAKAINPDGTIVVSVSGTLVLQMSNRPTTHQIEMDVLVGKDNKGLRVTGLYNRLTSVSSSVY